jgi:3-oxoacyl-(acyl-carrier-protein) synthase
VVFSTTLTGIVEVVSQVCGIIGRTRAVQTSCCSGLDAIGQAAELVAAGEVDLALCGGTECPLHQFPLLELRAAGLTPPTTEMPERMARPFDLWRTTGVVSEGAAVLVLEPESSPRVGYSFISGYGFASDPPAAMCGGLVQSARLALAASRLRPESIDCINAWGPGHKAVDAGEADAMVAVFGKGLERVPVFSIKGAIGSPLGAAPAIQVAVAALAHQREMIPPTVNWEYPDPACPLNLCNRARSIRTDAALVNAHGVGGVNTSLVLQRC